MYKFLFLIEINMAEKERSFGNWFKNLVKAPWRGLHATVINWSSDAINTSVWFFQDFFNTIKTTKDKIFDLFEQDKKWYQKLLNLPIAWVVGLSWIVEAAVKPVVKWWINSWKTAINLPLNAGKVVGTLFSAKPISEISYSKIKTKKWNIINFDTSGPWTWIEWLDKRVLNTNKSWFDGRWKRSKSKNNTAKTETASATNTTSKKEEKPEKKSSSESWKDALTAASVGTIVAEALKKNNESIDKKIKAITDSFTKTVWEAITTLQQEVSNLKQGAKAIEMKPENDWDKKGGKKPDADKEWWIDAARTSLEIGDSKEFSKKLLKDTPLLPIFEGILKGHPNLEINYNKNTIWSSITLWKEWYNDCIEIWSKIPENNISCAPMNWSNDHETQIRFSLWHEIAHFVFNKGKNENELLKICEKYAKDDKHLSSLSNWEIYDTSKKKALEDACELFTLYCTNKKGFYDYLDILSSDDEKAKETRNKYKLSKIENKNDIEDIKNECKKLANYCLNHYTQENMEGSIGAIAA